MKALVLDRMGRVEELRRAEMPLPEPGVGEIRVRVHAVGLNPVDYKLAASGHPAWQYPFILGLDVAGVVDSLGEGVTEWAIGDRVFYHGDLSKPGGFAEFAVTTAHTVAALPQGISFEEAAALPCAGLTAYQAIHRKLRVQAGQTILIHGGAGGVGGFAVQLAALAGLEVLATASAHNVEYVKQLGATHVIDYHTENIEARVHECTKGRGVDAVLDTLSKESATKALDLLAFNGQLVCIADLPDFARLQPFSRAISIHEVALGGAHLSGDRSAQEELAQMAVEFGELVRAQNINPMISDVLAMDEIPQGLVRLSKRHVRGKLVAKMVTE